MRLCCWTSFGRRNLRSSLGKTWTSLHFLGDLKTQSAILHQLMVMGEGVKRLSTAFRVQHPEVPWALIAGMRDKLIHGYDMVDLELVWQTVDNDVPALLSSIEPLLPKQK